MGKSAPSPPAAPDPAATARAQGAINKETAITQANLNRINQTTPQGTLTYSDNTNTPEYQAKVADYGRRKQDLEFRMNQLYGPSGWDVEKAYASLGDKPEDAVRYSSTVTYSPEQQRLYNLQTQAQERLGVTANEQLGRLQSSLNKPLNYDGLPDVGEYGADRQRTEDALYGRINPQLESDRAALEQRLANQGIAIGSQAYSAAMGDYGRQANDARYGAIMNAGQEQQRLMAQALARRQQGIQERASLRSQPLNEISADKLVDSKTYLDWIIEKTI